MNTNERFILEEKISKNYVWYVYKLEYYDSPDSDWILGSTLTQKREDAMQFCKSKAKRLAKILSDQIDKEGYSSQYKVVTV